MAILPSMTIANKSSKKNLWNLFSINFRINVEHREIWQPEISLINSITRDYSYGGTNSVVDINGTVVWAPPAKFETLCDSNSRYWPFDSHACKLRVNFQYFVLAFGCFCDKFNEIPSIWYSL